MTIFQGVLALVLAPTMIVAAIAYILRNFFSHILSRDLEKFRANLNSELEKSKIILEREFKRKAFEFETKFSLYHQKRADIISDIYQLLDEVYQMGLDTLSPMQSGGSKPRNERFSEAANAYNSLTKLYNNRRIYFTEEICTAMDSLLTNIRDCFLDYQFSQKPGFEGTKESRQMRRAAYDKLVKEVPPLKTCLEKEFRKTLSGVD